MFYLIIDVSMDVKKRKVIIILIGVLDSSEVDSKVLSVTFHSKVDSSVVIQSVNDSLGNLFENKVPYDKMILVVTDQAPYMIKAIQGLKLFFQNLNHITCVVHALNLLCNAIREDFDLVNDFVSNFKLLLSKAPKRIKIYQESTNLPLPPEPILTRWGTFLESSRFHWNNFEKINLFISNLEESDEKIDRINELYEKNVEKQLHQINKYSFLVEYIKKLEEKSLSTEIQYATIEDVSSKLTTKYKKKLKEILNKNPDFKNFKKVYESKKELLKFAPLSSVDVERSFSRFKLILSDRRQRLTEENLEKLIFIQFNNF